MSPRLLGAALLLGLVLAACSGGGTPQESDGSSSSTDRGQDSDRPSDGGATSPAPDGSTVSVPTGTPAEPENYTDSFAGHAFATPTGNIVCYLDVAQDRWGCLIGQRTYTEPAGAESCPAAFGNGFSSVQGGSLLPLCRGDVLAEAEDGQGAILPYGSTLTVGSVTCLSEKKGVTCVDQRSGHSLFLSKARYDLT